MYYDKEHFPLNETLDGMDSAMRAGVMGTFEKPVLKMYAYEIFPGLLCRHPNQVPSNNPYNFTRDQMMPLVSGLYFTGNHEIVRRVFWKTAKRFFFSQNTERDVYGSTKAPWPHRFINDQNKAETRSFDGPDPLFFHHIGHLILCGRIYSLYPLLCFSYPFLFLALAFNSTQVDSEQNQIQCMAKRAGRGWVVLYKLFNRNWTAQTEYYWSQRHESEYADLIMREL